jgi:hypothetical protein
MAPPAAMFGKDYGGAPLSAKDAIPGNLCQQTDTTISLNPLPSARRSAR